MIARGDVCWADLPAPVGSGPGYRRPVLVVQGDAFNRSRVGTVVCVPLASNGLLQSLPWGLHDAYLELLSIDWPCATAALTVRLMTSER